MAAIYSSHSSSSNFDAHDAITRAQNDMQRLLDGDANSIDDVVSLHHRSSSDIDNSTNGLGKVSQNGHCNANVTTTQSNHYATSIPSEDPTPHCVMANFAYTSLDANQLSFAKGDIIQVLVEDPTGWWEGVLIKSSLPKHGYRGWFPHNYVRKLSEESSRKAFDGYTAVTLGLNSQSMPLKKVAAHAAPTDFWDGADEPETLDTAIGVDVMLGRNAKKAGSAVEDLMESVLHGRGQYGEPLNDFSTGGDIFEELAAAAATTSHDDDTGLYGKKTASLEHVLSENAADETVSATFVEDDWLPRMSADGRIYYLNTRTGAALEDLPSAGLSSAITCGDVPASSAHQATATLKRSISTYSDDSDIDAGFSIASTRTSMQVGRSSLSNGFDPSATPRKVSNATFLSPGEVPGESRLATTPARRAPLNMFDHHVSRFAALHVACQRPQTKTWLMHELQCLEAIQHLVALVHGWEADPSTSGPLLATDVQVAGREQLETAFTKVHLAVAALLHATALVNEPSAKSLNNRHSTTSSSTTPGAWSANTQVSVSSPANTSFNGLPAFPSLDVSTFRPAVMKLTALLSKLALTVRTLWNQSAVSCVNKTSTSQDGMLCNDLTDDEREHITEQNQAHFVVRRQMRSRLGQDLIGQSQLLSGAINAFVDEVEAFAHSNGITARKDGLIPAKRCKSNIWADPIDLLQPDTAPVAALRGHGYIRAIMPSGKSASPAGTRPSALNIDAVMQEISPAGLGELSKLAAQLSAEVTVAQNVMSRLSPALSHTMQPADGVHCCEQFQKLLLITADFLRAVENMDLAKRLDIQLSPELYASLTGESLQSILEQDLFGEPLVSTSPGRSVYETCLSEAMVTLDMLRVAKHRVRVAMTQLTLSMQSAFADVRPGVYDLRRSSAKPAQCSPLNIVDGVLSQLSSIDDIGIPDILTDIASGCSVIVGCLSTALSIADRQATCNTLHRRANAALRASLLEPPTSAISASSSLLALPQAELRFHDDDITDRLVEARFDSGGGKSYRASLAPAASITEASSVTLVASYSAGRRSRSGSIADSLTSNDDLQQGSPNIRYRRDAAEDLRRAMQDAGLASPHHTSPSKSKLKQFFGADAPGNNVHRPPTTARDVPLFLLADYKHTDLSWASDGTVRGGTLYALVCRLTNHSSADASFNNAFLMTYRTFTTSETLLEYLSLRYRIEPPTFVRSEDHAVWVEQKQKLIRIRVTNVLRTWISEYLYDDEDEPSFKIIATFVETLPADTAVQLSRILERRRISGTPRRLTASISTGLAPNPIVPRSLKKIKFLEIDPLEVARQFTIMDSRLFTRITPEECLSKAWPKKFNRGTPTFQAIADMSNAVTAWVAMTIVLQPEARRRVAIVKHFIAIADKCRQLSNFTTLMHIVAGLNCSAVYRLKRTWEMVSQRAVSTLTFMGNLMSPENNHVLYRDALRLVGAPCVPFLGIFFTDWVMAGEANSDMLRDKPEQINFAKRSRVSDSIQQIQLQQATPYNLMPVPELSRWIDEELAAVRRIMTVAATTPNEGASTDIMAKAYELSLKIEPREREDERIARLLSESGFL